VAAGRGTLRHHLLHLLVMCWREKCLLSHGMYQPVMQPVVVFGDSTMCRDVRPGVSSRGFLQS
jgi:hypothetical protein